MKFKMHDTGYQVLSSLLVGSGSPVDTMYIELDTVGGAEEASEFGPGRQYASVPVRGTAHGKCASFSALVRSGDFGDWRPGRKITRATLMCDGVPVATSLVEPPVALEETAYTTVNVDIKFGD